MGRDIGKWERRRVRVGVGETNIPHTDLRIIPQCLESSVPA